MVQDGTGWQEKSKTGSIICELIFKGTGIAIHTITWVKEFSVLKEQYKFNTYKLVRVVALGEQHKSIYRVCHDGTQWGS